MIWSRAAEWELSWTKPCSSRGQTQTKKIQRTEKKQKPGTEMFKWGTWNPHHGHFHSSETAWSCEALTSVESWARPSRLRKLAPLERETSG